MKKIKIRNAVYLTFSLTLILLFLPQSHAQESGGFVPPKVSYDAMNLRDPFKSPIVSESENKLPEENTDTPAVLPVPLTVQGIIWGSDLLQAIINNKVVKVGETVDEAKIISIEKDFITVFAANRQFKLPSPALTPISVKSSDTSKKEDVNYSWQSYERKKEDPHER